MKYLKKILLLVAIISCSSIVFSQTSLNDSLTCFNKEQLSKIAQTISKVNLQDSIIQIQQLQIINFKEADVNLNKQKQVISNQLTEKTQQLSKANDKLKLSGFIIKFGLPGAFFGGFIISKL